MTLAGWSDAAEGNQPSIGRCRLGYVAGLMSANLCGPRRIIPWASQSTRKLVESSLGGEVYAFSEMLDHESMLREVYGHSVDVYPGMAGLEDCESPFAHLKKEKMITEKFSARHFSAIQQAIAIQELDNVNWIPGRANPADGLTELHSETRPLLRFMESGTYNPGFSRPLQGVAFRGP